mgnify:CR=1 FL=1
MPLVSRSAIKPPNSQETLTPQAQTRWDLIVGAIALGVVLIDQFTKRLVVAHFSGTHTYDVVPIFGKILSLEYTGNKGAAFSSFTQSPGLLAFLILVAVGVIGWLYWSTRPRKNAWLKATFGLIIGGAVGNLIDRVRLGYVVDFIHFQIPAIHFDFAIFNLADAAISVGVVLLAIIFWTLPREHAPEVAPASEHTAAAFSDQAVDTPTSAAKSMLVQTSASTTKTPTNSVKASTATKTPIAGATKTPTNPVKTPVPSASKPASAGATSIPVPRAAVTNRPSSKSKRKRR